jgi:hypothetical protein
VCVCAALAPAGPLQVYRLTTSRHLVSLRGYRRDQFKRPQIRDQRRKPSREVPDVNRATDGVFTRGPSCLRTDKVRARVVKTVKPALPYPLVAPIALPASA